MDREKELIKFLSLVGGIMPDSYLNQPMYFDEEVNDCLIKMYFFMMIGEGDPDKERLYNEFSLAYHSLSKEKQEIVKQDFINICEAQDRNEQEKVKRKGEMKNE